MKDEAPFSWVPLIATILLSGGVAVAIWRFNRKEL